MEWSPPAEETLSQALKQAPGPAFLHGMPTSRLRSSAESAAVQAGHTAVQPEDLMQGLLEMLPPHMRETIEKRLAEGPAGLPKLQDDLKDLLKSPK